MINFETTQYTGLDHKYIYEVYSTNWGWAVNKWPIGEPKIPPLGRNLTQDLVWSSILSKYDPGFFPSAEAVFEILDTQRLYALTR